MWPTREEFVKEFYTQEYIQLVQKTITAVLLVKGQYRLHADELEDMVQTTFKMAWRAYPRYRWDMLPGQWLNRIASRIALDRCRQNVEREVAISKRTKVPSWVSRIEPPDPYQFFEDAEEIRLIRLRFENLSPYRSAIIRLRLEDDLSFKEIAERMRSTEGAVKNAFFKAKQSLREQILPAGGLQ